MAGSGQVKDEFDGSISAASETAVVDGVDTGIKGTVFDKTNSNPLAVAVVDSNGDQITSFGGGTQYTEGDTDASITGTAILWEDASDTLRPVSASKPLPVSVKDSALPTGAATSDKQDTIIGHVDGIETLLTAIDGHVDQIEGYVDGIEALLATIDADTGNIATSVASIDSKIPASPATSGKQDTGNTALAAIQTAIEILDNIVSGNEAQVDVITLPAIPAGNNNIGDVDVASIAAGNNNIGDVDIASIAAGDNNIGNVDVVTLPSLPAGTNAIGKLLPPDIDVTGHTNYARKYYTNAGAVTDGIIWSPAAGKRWHVVALYINVSAAATVTLEDDKSGGDDPVFKSEFAANSGVFLTFPEKYPMASGEDAADLLITTSAGNVYVTAVGYEI